MAKFKTRARALDLLGRQQIAGIPTAINELIKNAHDAYADRFDIDFLRKDNLLVLRDDGLGMTREEFETRWLIIGTESKFLNSKISLPPKDESKLYRPVMGEKGIGRLAIASIGKQVLVITKSKNRENNQKIVAVLINWEIFELPGINLEDIVIPIKEFDSLPNQDDIEELKSELLASLENILDLDIITGADFSKVSSSIRSLKVNPKSLNKQLVGHFNIEDEYIGGTFFYVSPVSENLVFDIEGEKDTKEASKIEKMLIGFHNTMTPDHPDPIIDINFRDHKGVDGTYINLIDREQFFTPEEFELADHHFKGVFDAYGQFRGDVKIYKQRKYDHIVNWRGNNFNSTDCGSFSINLAYVQGKLKDSIIDLENWNRLTAKADKFGGLYIYKDNIRVLPYGDSDYDFIDIEKNRSKRASTYFFSYRRMFGVINITHKDNQKLVEKAGREGFIENKAFRQLQAILKNFFLQLAADFFDETGKTPQSEFYIEKKKERNTFYKALERRDKLAKSKKARFLKELDTFFKRVSERIFDKEVNSVVEAGRRQLNSFLYLKDLDEAAQKVIDTEFDTRQKIAEYKRGISVSSPKGFTISKSNRIDYETYLSEFKVLEETLFKNAIREIDIMVSDVGLRLDVEISKRKRLEQAVEFISSEALKINTKKRNETTDVVNDVSKKIKDVTSQLMLDLDFQIRSVKDKFKTLTVDKTEDFDLVEERKKMETEIEMISSRNTHVMERIIRQFESFYIEKDEDGNIITNDQISDALAEELDELRERLNTDIELSQLGLAVGILHHEFSSTVMSIRSSIKDLKAWSDVNSQLEDVYSNIKVNFEHLDGYLNLFTPLNRRLNRRKEEVGLLEIKTFLIDLFKSRMERHKIEFKHTRGFAAGRIYGFRSTFYPVFVNLIDNAIYWLNQSFVDRKIIRLHADSFGIYVSNNGVEIPVEDSTRIFKLGFSRKTYGRGMGLSISKEVLNAENYDLSLVTPKDGSRVTFRIEAMKTEEGNE